MTGFLADRSTEIETAGNAVSDEGPPYASHEDLRECDGLLLGSPTRFGNMAAALKYFIGGTGGACVGGRLEGKPAGFFTSTSSLNGGQETTLLSMALPLMHHGMLLVGVRYSEPALNATRSGGTPYGVTHIAYEKSATDLTPEETAIAQTLRRRVAEIAARLNGRTES